jgi:hypothetical protein
VIASFGSLFDFVLSYSGTFIPAGPVAAALAHDQLSAAAFILSNCKTNEQTTSTFAGKRDSYPDEEQVLARARLATLFLGSLLLESSLQRQMQQAMKFGILCEG